MSSLNTKHCLASYAMLTKTPRRLAAGLAGGNALRGSKTAVYRPAGSMASTKAREQARRMRSLGPDQARGFGITV